MAIEVYDRGRYFTVTGQHLPGTSTNIEQRQDAYLKLEEKYLTQQAKSSKKADSKVTIEPYYQDKDDDEVISTIRKSRDSEMFSTLHDKGDLSLFNGDHSKGDYAYCCILGKYYNGDTSQIERIFSRSALSRDK